MRSNWLRILGNCAVVVLIGGAGHVLGHSDPRGDIHPQVSVMDGMFAIIFETSQPDQDNNFTATKPVQRMIFTADGKLFAPRHPLARRRSWHETGPVGLYGRQTRLGEFTVIFPGAQADHPGYLLRSPGGWLTRVRLPWPETVTLNLLEDTLVVTDGIAMTGKDPAAVMIENGPLNFYWFAHESTGAPVVLTIGATACIYQFPVASNIAFAGGRFWVAYMRLAGDAEVKLALWSWKPGDKDGRVEDLESPAHWNSHLSLAAIGDRLCLAYHCETNHDSANGRGARIITVFRKAE